MNALLLVQSLGLAGALVTAWLLAGRVGPDWLRPGHGPLWFAAAGVTAALGVALSLLPEGHAVLGLYDRLGAPTPFNSLVKALLVLVGTFPLLRIGLGLLRPARADRPPVPYAFLVAGIAPDGSPLVAFRWLLSRALAGALLVSASAALVLPAGIGPDHAGTSWGFYVAALLGLFFGTTHPAVPLPSAIARGPADGRSLTDVLADQLRQVHLWLGAPQTTEQIPPVSPVVVAQRSEDSDAIWLGLRPYGYQRQFLQPGRSRAAVGLAGPDGSGRTTALLMRAIRLAVEDGSASLVVTPDESDAARTAAYAEALLRRLEGGAAVALARGSRLDAGDIWIVGLDELEEFFDETSEPTSNPFFARLRLVAVEDLERLPGPAIARARFLANRAVAAARWPAPAVVVTGNLAPAVLNEMGMHVTATTLETWTTAAPGDPDGATSRGILRCLLDPARVQSTLRAVQGMRGIRDGFIRLVEQLSLDGDAPLSVEVLGEPWPAYPGPENHEWSVARPRQVLLARIGPRTAWRVLGQRRFYAADGEPAREYLAFAEDPLSQMLRRLYERTGQWWPEWYDTRRFPRALSPVLGRPRPPEGVVRMARSQLRAALEEGDQEIERLRAVFGEEVAQRELRTLENSRLFHRYQAWFPPDDPGESGRPRIAEMCRAPGIRDDLGRHAGRTVQLRHADTNRSFRVPSVIADIEYYPLAVFERWGKRFQVRAPHDLDVTEPPLLREIQEVTDSAIWMPIRRIHCVPHQGPLTRSYCRFAQVELTLLRGNVRLEIEHHGARSFIHALDETENRAAGGARGPAHRRQAERILYRPALQLDEFTTSAWVVCLPDASEAVLHTLVHVLRETLDYFFLGASSFLGVTYEMDIEGLAGIVFYDRHPEGMGCLSDVDDHADLEPMLKACRDVLRSCSCRPESNTKHGCPLCCESTRCSLRPHNHLLDRSAAQAVLDRVLGS